MLETKVTCLNRFLGRCTECSEDYNTNHHPNNYDCKNYKPTKYFELNVEVRQELSEVA
jgi:hypothetical protein